MRAPLPLLSAIGFLVAAGAIAARPSLLDAALGFACVLVALAMLRDRDRQIASEAIDGAMDLLKLQTAKALMKGEWP